MKANNLSILSRRASVLLSASVGVLAMAAPAVAQDETTSGVDTITVTAQFREQNLQDTPLSITAVDAALLEARNQDSLLQIAYQAPNVILNSMSSTFGTGIGAQIRGVGQFDFNPALEPAVGIYIDDVYYSSLVGANMDLLDLERVEILRGPQGTLAGRNTAGGAIRLISAKPNGDGGASLSAGYGSFNAIDLRASIDFGLTDDLAVRVSGVHKEADGHIKRKDYGCSVPGNPEGIAPTGGVDDSCVVDRLGSIGYTGIRTQVQWEPSDRLAVTIIGDYTASDETAGGDVTAVAANPNFLCGEYCTYADFRLTGGQPDFTTGAAMAPDTYQPASRTYDGWGVSGKLAYDVTENLQFESVTAYREFNTVFGTDDDFSPQLDAQAGGYNDIDFDFFSQEIRLNGSLGDGFAEFTLGAFYHDQTTTYFTIQDIRYIFPAAWQFVGNDPVNADSKAVFGTLILHPVENLNVTAGLRYTDEHKDYTFSRTSLDGTLPAALTGGLDGLTAVYDGDKIDYRVSVDYRFSDAFLAYGTVSTGFKGGGVTPRPFNEGQALNGSFEPETVRSYEIGFKSDLFDNRLRLNVAGFIAKYTDIQLPLNDCSFANPGDFGPCGMITNAGDATFKGVEAEVLFEPTDSMSIDLSGSWLDSEYDSVLPAAGGGVTIFPGDPASNAPEWKFSAGIQNVFELGGDKGTITPRFDISYVDERFVGNASGADYFLPDYFLANARIAWRNPDEDLTISLGVTNLFDEYYTTWRFESVQAFSGNAQDAVGRPREWMLTVKKEF